LPTFESVAFSGGARNPEQTRQDFDCISLLNDRPQRLLETQRRLSSLALKIVGQHLEVKEKMLGKYLGLELFRFSFPYLVYIGLRIFIL